MAIGLSGQGLWMIRLNPSKLKKCFHFLQMVPLKEYQVMWTSASRSLFSVPIVLFAIDESIIIDLYCYFTF